MVAPALLRTRGQLESRVRRLLDSTGIRVNGDGPVDIQVHDPRFYARVLSRGSLGLGESYMDGWWDCDQLDAFIAAVLRAGLADRMRNHVDAWDYLCARLINAQRGRRSFRVAERHYDLGNDFYRDMLDPGMNYSCGYWGTGDPAEKEPTPGGLEAAQTRKLEMVARKLKLKPGMRVLDIGCGWGGAARYLAEHYGVEVVGVTISREQVRFAEQACEGLPVTIRLQDYRQLTGRFDRVFSIGMFEHVGYRNYRTFMETVRSLLDPEGLFLLHTIASNTRVVRTDPWIARYIFPNSMAPYPGNIGRAAAGRFVLEDWQNIGPHYDPTLRAWHRNVSAVREAWLADARLDERFFRMWRYYLLCCAAIFRVRRNQVWQVVMSPGGWPGGYQRPAPPE